MKDSDRFSVHLDSFRGIAALAVVLYHIRFRFFLDYPELPASSIVARAFYTVTAFGHDAVMVFFVLSGYLISGSVFRDLQAGRWSWKRYFVHRLTRLYVVLIPALLLTMVWDMSGLHWFGTNVSYTGARTPWKHDYIDIRPHLTPTALLGNTFFLQRVLVPTFGSNTPLWSLAFEMAYYVLLPLALLACWPSTPVRLRLAYAVVAVCLGVFYGAEIMSLAPIWLLGFGIWLLPSLSLPRVRPRWLWSAAIPAALVTFVAAGHLEAAKAAMGHSLLFEDYTTGIATAVALYALKGDSGGAPSRAWHWWATSLAGFSYTLYATHFPVLVFLRAAVAHGVPWAVSARTLAATATLTAFSLVYAWLVWYVSEARTARVRDMVSRTLARYSAPRG